MLNALATPKHRRVTLVFLAVFCLAAIATLAIGLDGNTPALVLAAVAAIALVLAFVHPWRRARQFKYLFYASGLGFGVFVLLHNFFEAGAVATASVGPLHAILQGLSVVAFLAAVFVCPPAMVIGLAGALIMFFRGRKAGQPEPSA
jgi:hypothetical protein